MRAYEKAPVTRVSWRGSRATDAGVQPHEGRFHGTGWDGGALVAPNHHGGAMEKRRTP